MQVEWSDDLQHGESATVETVVARRSTIVVHRRSVGGSEVVVPAGEVGVEREHRFPGAVRLSDAVADDEGVAEPVDVERQLRQQP